MNTNDDLAPEWDALLDEGLIEPPADFHSRVMQRVHQEAVEPAGVSPLIRKIATALQAAAVLLGMLAAGWQTLAFVLGLWATSIAI